MSTVNDNDHDLVNKLINLRWPFICSAVGSHLQQSCVECT